MSGTGSRKSNDLAEQWHRANEYLNAQKANLIKAEQLRADAANALGKHLCPSDAIIGEKFQMWIRVAENDERIVSVIKLSEEIYEVHWRE